MKIKTKLLSILLGFIALTSLMSVTIANGDKITLANSSELDVVIPVSAAGPVTAYITVVSSTSGVQISDVTITSNTYAVPANGKVIMTVKVNTSGVRSFKVKGTSGDVIYITW